MARNEIKKNLKQMKISILKSKQIRCLKELKKCLRNGKLYFPVMSGKGAPHHGTGVSILSLQPITTVYRMGSS